MRGYHARNSHSSTLIIALMLPLGLDFLEIENSYRPMPRQSFRRVLHLIQLEIRRNFSVRYTNFRRAP